jgi:hypothetical protein
MRHTSINKSNGFTIVEMIVIAPIVILVIGVFIYAIVTMTGDVMATRSANKVAYDIQDALNRIESDVKTSNGWLNTSFSTSLQGLNNDDTAFSKSSSTLIISTFATTDNPLSSTRSLVYKKGAPNLCDSLNVNQNEPIMLNIVYFIKNNILWRRIVGPPTEAEYKGCNALTNTDAEPWQKPSCSTEVAGDIGILKYPCKTADMKLIDGGINPISLDIDYTSSNNPPDNFNVSVTISATTSAAGRPITQSGTVTAVSLNKK